MLFQDNIVVVTLIAMYIHTACIIELHVYRALGLRILIISGIVQVNAHDYEMVVENS